MLANLVIALLGRVLGSPYPIPLVVLFWFLAVIVALAVLGQPARTRLILVPVAWWIASFVCVALAVILAALYALIGISASAPRSGVLALAAVASIAAHTLILRRGNRELRRKVMASPPLKVLFLWVFGSYSPVFLFLGFAAVWRFLGSIQLLNGAGFMGDSVETMKSFARGKSADLIVKTPDEVAAKIRTFHDEPNRMSMYPHHTLLCNDKVWKLALHTLLAGTDVIVMDLRGFSPENQGATYELGQLIDCFPRDRFVLLADDSTDVAFLSTTLHRAWDAMAIDSPNRHPSPAPVRVFHLGHGAAKRGEFPQLPAIAREGDRLLEALCECAVAPRRQNAVVSATLANRPLGFL